MIAWLDASTEDQRRMREIVNLFSERDSRDELGIGQVRDALSDTLFPGTSTLLGRARYMLLIPWCFTAAASSGRTPGDISKRVDLNERDLITALKENGDEVGLLGRVAGRSLRTLPSSLYWVALRQYGILASPSLDRQVVFELSTRVASDFDEGEGESSPWSPTLPAAPAGFPKETAGGFALNSFEAGWLSERMLEGSEGTLLSHFVQHRPDTSSKTPWDAASDAPAAATVALEHARLFSFAMHGAALLYNLLLAEAYEAHEFTTIEAPVDRYRDYLGTWQVDLDLMGSTLADWDRNEFWRLVRAKNPGVVSQPFIDRWIDHVIGLRGDIASDPASREVIADRERRHKRSQARLDNRKLLEGWRGASGAGRLIYRWPQVLTILTDLHDGLERADA